LLGKPEGKEPIRKLKLGCVDNVKIDLRYDVGYGLD
jgi:hypothetical protein